eukprot:TRINITY_DN7469_c0_g1_i1.p1 TRINITY_DN7469_c0_g1~~TRINITY_DN7469_c0_g1_i1.p1  ORF type:complete len:215 (+),score=33.34 TRINITY_DN7469_c0_g1_i1:33-647(+)
MGKRMLRPVWEITGPARGGLPRGCLDVADPGSALSYPTGCTLSKEQFVHRAPNPKEPCAGHHAGSTDRQLEAKFNLFEWAVAHQKPQEILESLESCNVQAESRRVRSRAPSEVSAAPSAALRAAGAQVFTAGSRSTTPRPAASGRVTPRPAASGSCTPRPAASGSCTPRSLQGGADTLGRNLFRAKFTSAVSTIPVSSGVSRVT